MKICTRFTILVVALLCAMTIMLTIPSYAAANESTMATSEPVTNPISVADTANTTPAHEPIESASTLTTEPKQITIVSDNGTAIVTGAFWEDDLFLEATDESGLILDMFASKSHEVYCINIYNNNSEMKLIDLPEEMTVSIKIPDRFKNIGHVEVYSYQRGINGGIEGSSATSLSSTRNDDYITFTTSKLGWFVVTDEDAVLKPQPDVPDTPVITNPPTNTGSNHSPSRPGNSKPSHNDNTVPNERVNILIYTNTGIFILCYEKSPTSSPSVDLNIMQLNFPYSQDTSFQLLMLLLNTLLH